MHPHTGENQRIILIPDPTKYSDKNRGVNRDFYLTFDIGTFLELRPTKFNYSMLRIAD
jgi:hypothetical protein